MLLWMGTGTSFADATLQPEQVTAVALSFEDRNNYLKNFQALPGCRAPQ
jgi:hypothetical protein